MKVAEWFDSLEHACGPMFAWAVAVLVVVVGLPPVLLWHFVRAGRQVRRGGQAGKPSDYLPAVCPTPGGAGPVAA